MKRDIHLVLQDEELVDLCRILIDGDPEGALAFLREHLRGRARELLEGGWKVLLEVPGAGIAQPLRWGSVSLLNSVALVRMLPCLAEPGKIIVVGETDAALDGVLPLLNAILPNVVSYNPFSGVMTLRRRPGLITIYPRRVMITQVRDVEEGLALLAATRDLLNQTWERRDEIQPRPEGRRVPRPLDVYELLPRTNCRACGEATCMAFVFGLLEARHRPEDCPILADPGSEVQRAALDALLLNLSGDGGALQPD